jgi:hypothetical protein
MRSDGFFSGGGLLSVVWRPGYPLLPWALTSAMLTLAAMWDFWSRGAPIEFSLLGLAAYELMMGLMATSASEGAGPARAARAPSPASRSEAPSTAR